MDYSLYCFLDKMGSLEDKYSFAYFTVNGVLDLSV